MTKLACALTLLLLVPRDIGPVESSYDAASATRDIQEAVAAPFETYPGRKNL